jgi:RimJ/RimL family protein N-acetyltransferase
MTSGPPNPRSVIAYMVADAIRSSPVTRSGTLRRMSWDPWPLRHLVLRTPRLSLRPDDDAGLLELAEEARLGVHPPGTMPFSTPWTDASPEERGLATLRWHWERRAVSRPERWSLQFLVRFDGRVVGVQGLYATEFAVTRDVETGSWLGLRHHRRGIGTEMRAAVLMFAFDHLGATQARSGAFLDNPASLRVSETLGYRPDGIDLYARRGERAENVRLLLTREAFRRPDWALQVEGVAACLPMLGITPGSGPGDSGGNGRMA